MTTLTSGSAARQLAGGLDPVHAGHLDVEEGDVGVRLARGGDHLVAAADLGHDGHVRFEVEQGGERAADEGLVVGEQEPDRHRGVSTR